ncbi:MAG: Mrp/NBP35 family ATP-binding protein [Pacificimonas sp.]
MPTEDELKARLREIAGPRVSGVSLRGGNAGYVLDIGGLDAEAVAALRQKLDGAVPNARVITTSAGAPSGSGERRPSGRARQAHEAPAPKLTGIGTIVAVASGKGGVGKSTVAANLAVALAQGGLKVGLLDADIYGPSVPTLLDAHGKADGEQGRILPLEAHGIKSLSIANLTPPGQAMIWRGPMASAAMMQMLSDGDWTRDGDLDILVMDMPPGTGDIQLSLAQKVKDAGPTLVSVVVSTPQDLALIDAEKAMAMFAKVGIDVVGLVENMSTVICPACGTATPIFGEGTVRETSAKRDVPFLGAVPLTMALRESADAGTPAVLGDGPAAEALRTVAAALRAELGV